MCHSRRPNWQAAVLGLLLAGILGGAGFLLWRLLTSRFHGPPTTAQVVVAGLALIGVLTTALVTAIGLALKQSIDRRTLELSQSEHRRQQMETALQTVKMMTADNGQTAPRMQVSAALIVLSRLGELNLAIDLAAEMWPQNQISSSAAVRVVDYALADADSSLQREAALLIMNNFTSLDTAVDQCEWPGVLDVWPEAAKVDDEARVVLALALSKWIACRKPKNEEDFRVKLLRQAQERDCNANVTRIASMCMMQIT